MYQEARAMELFFEMQKALQQFEATADPEAAPSRQKAFYSALKKSLADCMAEASHDSRSIRIAATHHWFAKNRPSLGLARPQQLMQLQQQAQAGHQGGTAELQQHVQQGAIPAGGRGRQAAGDAAASSGGSLLLAQRPLSRSKQTRQGQVQPDQQLQVRSGKADFFSTYARDPAQLFSSPRNIALGPAGAAHDGSSPGEPPQQPVQARPLHAPPPRPSSTLPLGTAAPAARPPSRSPYTALPKLDLGSVTVMDGPAGDSSIRRQLMAAADGAAAALLLQGGLASARSRLKSPSSGAKPGSPRGAGRSKPASLISSAPLQAGSIEQIASAVMAETTAASRGRSTQQAQKPGSCGVPAARPSAAAPAAAIATVDASSSSRRPRQQRITAGSDGAGDAGADEASKADADEADTPADMETLRAMFSEQQEREAAYWREIRSRMDKYTSSRARVEEEMLRRQEAQLYSTAKKGGGQGARPATAPAAGGAAARSAQLLATATSLYSTKSAAVDLASLSEAQPGSTVKQARDKVAHEVAAECQQVVARLAARGNEGICTSETLARALMPLPDVPYLSCIAQLPKPGAYLKAIAAAIDTKKAAGKKGKGGSKTDGKKKKKKAK